MRFRTWILKENSLNAGFPEVLAQVNKADSVPASAEVVRTGLQPQVHSEEIPTAEKEEQEKIQAIDSTLQELDKEIENSSNEQINKFKKIWDELKEKWQLIKSSKPDVFQKINISGLGGSTGDQKLVQYMQQNPNSTLDNL